MSKPNPAPTQAQADNLQNASKKRAPSAPSTPPGEPYNWKRGIDELKESLFDKPAAYFDMIFRKSQNLPQTNFELAAKLAAQGKHWDAIKRYQFALKLSPMMSQCYYPIGMSYAAMGSGANAAEAFRHSIASARNVDESRFMLASLNPGEVLPQDMPSRMPASLAQMYFDQIAPVYDAQQREQDYKGHMITAQYLYRHTDPKRKDYQLLDAGCGTGLIGRTLHDRMGHITGIDISSGMISQARKALDAEENAIYHALYHTDIHDYVTSQAEANQSRFNCITLARLPAYLGALDNIIPALAAMLKPEGVIVMVYESFSELERFGFSQTTGRYGHGDGYIRTQAEKSSLNVADLDSVTLANDLVGKVAVLKKA